VLFNECSQIMHALSNANRRPGTRPSISTSPIRVEGRIKASWRAAVRDYSAVNVGLAAQSLRARPEARRYREAARRRVRRPGECALARTPPAPVLSLPRRGPPLQQVQPEQQREELVRGQRDPILPQASARATGRAWFCRSGFSRSSRQLRAGESGIGPPGCAASRRKHDNHPDERASA